MNTPEPFSISCDFDAPRALVFLAHTDPVHIARWYGPAGATVLKADLDLRPGGIHHYGLRMPDGLEMWGKQTFLEIVAPEKLVLVQSFSDPQGGLTRHPLAATWPLEMLATTTFEELPGGKTRLTVSWAPHESDEAGIATFDGARGAMSGGFKGTFDSLAAYLRATDTKLTQSRLLRAPRELVWEALTDPRHVNVWWGPTGFRNVEVEQDVRVGGVWRFKMIGPDGTVWPNKITYLELSPPERMVFEHGDFDAVHFRNELTLTEENGHTRITLSVQFAERAARDAVVQRGAIEGGQQTLSKLGEHLRKM